jgi:hypothetical protein
MSYNFKQIKMEMTEGISGVTPNASLLFIRRFKSKKGLISCSIRLKRYFGLNMWPYINDYSIDYVSLMSQTSHIKAYHSTLKTQ